MRKGLAHRMMAGIRKLQPSAPRYTTVMPAPLQQNSPWYWTAGPVFSPGADGAILHSKLSKPWQTLFGYAYRVANPQKYTVFQPAQLYAPKGVPIVGINIQTGWQTVYTPAGNSDGSFAMSGILNTNGTLAPTGVAAQASSLPIDYGEAVSSETGGDYA